MRRERALKIVLVVVGLLFCAGVYPLLLMVKQDPALAMMMSLYATLGVFLVLASRSPSAHRSLIAFTAWSSFAHAAVMSFQALLNMISIVVYSSFESQRVSELALWLPKYAGQIGAIQARLFDLLPVVNRHNYSKFDVAVVVQHVICSITSSGLAMPPDQKASQTRSIWFRSSPVSMIVLFSAPSVF